VAGGRYRFRVRFNIADGHRVNIDEDEIVLHEDSETVVWLRAVSAGESLQDADVLLMLGSAYASEEEARAAGVRWRGVLERTYAALVIAADFGDYAAKGGGFTPAFLDDLREKTGQFVMNEVHGLMVVPDDLTAVAITASAKVRAGTPKERFVLTLSEAIKAPEVSNRERLAFDLYSAAAFVAESPAARFMMLMMALEALIEVGDRDLSSRQHIDRLIEMTDEAELDHGDAERLKNALRGMKLESVRSAGRRLVAALDGRTYDGMAPAEFFGHCYSIRSALAHGAESRPDRDLVSRTAAQLEVFVGHLIAGRAIVDVAVPVAVPTS
jgi:hypothetical protein